MSDNADFFKFLRKYIRHTARCRRGALGPVRLRLGGSAHGAIMGLFSPEATHAATRAINDSVFTEDTTLPPWGIVVLDDEGDLLSYPDAETFTNVVFDTAFYDAVSRNVRARTVTCAMHTGRCGPEVCGRPAPE